MDNSENQTKATLENQLIDKMIKERRSERYWRNFRFLIWILLLLLYAYLIFKPSHPSSEKQTLSTKEYVSLVRLSGIILPESSFSAMTINKQLIRAFADKKSKGVILLINSVGGSPVQAEIIRERIVNLKKLYKKKVVVVGEDALASGAYLIATAGDKIFVNNDTLTGSIGVIMEGFGFNEAMNKLGITRRVFTAGENKDRLDPFQPLKPEDIAKLHTVLGQVHQSFIQDVIHSRGDRLHGDRQQIFSGDFWTGQGALELGLVDGIANLWEVMHSEFKVKHYLDYSQKPGLVEVLLKGVDTQLNLGFFSNNTHLKSELGF